MGIVIRGRGVIIQVGTHSASCLQVVLGRRLWAPGRRPVVVDVGCRSVVVGPRLPLTAWHPHGRSWVVWAVAVRGWVMVIGDGGWCLRVVVVRGWAVFVIRGQLSSLCGWSLFMGGWLFLGGRDRCSWVGDGGRQWWCCRSLSWGHGHLSSRKQLSTWNALMGVPCQRFGGGAVCWVPSLLPSPLSMSVIIVGIVGIVIIGVVVVSSSVSHCVVVVVSDGDGGGDG